jgi:ABC-type dipeptide/oligopeptide/nickel transport system permease component
MARITRLTRSGMLEVLSQDYIRTARAKGLVSGLVIARHAVKNTLIPIITILGIDLGFLLSGAVVTETIFSWPGVGRQLLQSVSGRDYPVVQACVFVIAILVVGLNLVVDLLYRAVDPRIKLGAG